MRRLLFVVPDFFPNNSGYANACTAFVLALAKGAPYEIDVLTFAKLRGNQELAIDRVTIRRLEKKRVLGFSSIYLTEYDLWRHIRRLVRERGHEFVIFETAEYPLAGVLALRFLGRDRVIVRVHAASETEWALYRRRPFKYRLKKRPTRAFFRNVRTIFSTNRYYLGFIQTYFLNRNPLLIAEKYFQVIPNITPAGELGVPHQEAPSGAFAPEGEMVFVTLGRMDYHGELQKNFGRLLIGVSLVKKQAYFRKLRLIVIGLGSQRPYLENLSRELGIDRNVIFHDSMTNEEVQELQRSCQGVILASTYEGMSMFAAEGLANGAPLLFANSGGLRDLVDDGRNGVVFNPLDAYDIASKIDVYVREHLPRIDAMRKASREKHEREFSEGVVVKKFLENLDILVAMTKAREGFGRGDGR